MKLIIKMMELTSFKGVKHKVYKFDADITKVMGCNGSGKSTLASAYTWVMADADYNLNKNPDVIPLGETECRPTVKIWFELGGKELTVQKEQVVKIKTVDDKVQTSITNNYSINDVEKKFSDFVTDLKERGIDMDRFLQLSNPNAFLADTSKKGRDEMRKTLFEMVDDVSDKDIAEECGLSEVKTLLEDYRLDEITAMNKSTIRKITEKNGKNNEIINGRIDGMIQSKASVDVKELEKQKVDYEKELSEIKKQITDISGADNKKRKEISDLKNKLHDIEQKAHDEFKAFENDALKKLRNIENIHAESEVNLINKRNVAKRLKGLIADKEGSVEGLRDSYKKIQKETLDENELICPTCGQALPDEQADNIKEKFEKSKAERLKNCKSDADKLKKEVEADKKEMAKFEKDIADSEKQLEGYAKEIEILKENMRTFEEPNMNDNEEYQRILKDIQALEDELSKSGDLKLQELSNRESYLDQMIKQVIGELAVAGRNKNIDKQIEALREERKTDEVEKAKAEKILSQVSDLEMSKNNKLTEMINSNFSKVKWRLFKTLKNGEVEPDVTPLIDGKPLNSSCNGSLITLAKISICVDLQRYFNEFAPIWCDDFSLFSNNTKEMLDVKGTQFIGLVVNDDKEVTIERG